MSRLGIIGLMAMSLYAQTTEMGAWIRYRRHLSYMVTIHITYWVEER